MKKMFYVLALIMASIVTARAALGIEHVTAQNTGTHARLAKLSPEPARGQSITQPETGVVLRRLTDVSVTTSPASANPSAWNGLTNAGLTNGYSRRQCVNVTEEYALAFMVSPAAYLIRLSDLKPLGIIMSKSGLKIGDSNELKWEKAPGKQYWVTYCIGPFLYEQNILIGPSSETSIPLGANDNATDDGDISADGRYEAQSLTNKHIVVIDLVAGKVLPGYATQSTVGVDISPDGKWVRGAAAYYPVSEFVSGVQNIAPINGPGGHGGWCALADGTNVFVQQNISDDWLVAFNPATAPRGVAYNVDKAASELFLMRMPEIGDGNYNIGVHVAADRLMAAPGWALVSVYATTATLTSNVFWIELRSCKAAGAKHTGANLAKDQFPRIVRVCDCQHKYTGNYFTEMWASISPSARWALWGGNWNATDNLELYRAELPADMLAFLGIKATPTPSPTPTVGAQHVELYAGCNVPQWGIANYPIGPDGVQQNFIPCIYNMTGTSTRGNLCIVDCGRQDTFVCNGKTITSATLTQGGGFNSGEALFFNLSKIPKGTIIKRARLGLFTRATQADSSNHPTGDERVPIRQITNPMNYPKIWTCAYIRPDAPAGDTSENSWNGASFSYWREEFTGYNSAGKATYATAPWGPITSPSPHPLYGTGYGRFGNIIYNATKPIPGDPLMSFNPDVKSISYSSDLTALVQTWIDNPSQNWGIYLDADAARGQIYFIPTNKTCPVAKCFVSVATCYQDAATRPRLVLEY